MSRTVPLYAKLIKIGSNVQIASNVYFVTHDVIHSVINNLPDNKKYVREKVGCIEVGDNVFIGSNTTILQDVKIGSNVVIGANTLVNKDIPDNSVVAGIPATIVGNFNSLVNKRIEESQDCKLPIPKSETISEEDANKYWDDFIIKRNVV